ncbi:MAG: recombinase family protein [Ramlibacter sp.]
MNTKYISYIRVSTVQQGRSGLGLEAQVSSVAGYLRDRGTLLAEFREVETGKGANALSKRPELRAALAACKRYGATLVIAKLDRLARNVHFVTGLLESGCEFVAADMPHANKVMIQMHAVMSEWERDQISERTKAALAAAKARGVKLGLTGSVNLKRNIDERTAIANAFAMRLKGLVDGFKVQGLTQREMTDQLNAACVPSPRGGGWSLAQTQRLLTRISSAHREPSASDTR